MNFYGLWLYKYLFESSTDFSILIYFYELFNGL